MQTLLLGSSGFFGSEVAKLLAKRDCFGSLILATRDTEKVSNLTNELGNRASSVVVDILDKESLKNEVIASDLVVNAAGATLETAVPAMLAAAEAGVSYCDIAAEADVLLQAEEFEGIFAKSGATILVGAGFHPGVTDLLGRAAIDELDEVHTVDFYIVGNFPDYGDPNGMLSVLETGWQGSEGLKTILAGIGLPATIVRNGERDVVDPWATKLVSETPDGIEIDFTYFSTLEPLALTRSNAAIVNSAMHYGAWPNAINAVLKKVAPRASTGTMPSGEALKSVFAAAKSDEGSAPKVHFWAEASGKKSGKTASCQVFSAEPWATNTRMIATTTGVLVLAAEKLATGSIKKTGLVTAGDVLEPDEVFQIVSGSKSPKITKRLTY